MNEDPPSQLLKFIGIFSLWRPIKWFFGVLVRPTGNDFLTSITVVMYWSRQRLKMWFVVAFIASVLVFITMTYASQVNIIEQVLAHFPSTIAKLPPWIRSADASEKVALARAATTIHFAIGILLTLYFFLILGIYDPMRNRELLLDLANDRKPEWRLFSIARSLEDFLKYYAKEILPSARLHSAFERACYQCATENCSNKLNSTSPIAVLRWLEISTQIDKSLLNAHLYLSQRCRLIFMICYGCIVAILIALAWYWLVQLLEYLLTGAPRLSPLGFLLIVIIFPTIFYSAKVMNSVAHRYSLGFWRDLKHSVERIFSDPLFGVLYDKEVCKAFGKNFSFTPKTKIQGKPLVVRMESAIASQVLVKTLDEIVFRKLILVCGNRDLFPGDRALLSSILVRCEAYFRSQYESSVRVAVRLFFLEDNNLCEAYFYGDPVSLQEPQRISMQSDRPLARACKLGRPLLGVDHDLRPDQACTHPLSAISYPLCVDSGLMQSAEKGGFKVPKLLGVLLLEADSEHVFSHLNFVDSASKVHPFASRLMFEIISQLRHQSLKNKE